MAGVFRSLLAFWLGGASDSYTPSISTTTPSNWARALRDPSIPIHWLLEVDITAAVTLRYCGVSAHVGGYQFLGALEVDSVPSVSVDPYSSSSEAYSCSVRLAPVPGGIDAAPDLLPMDAAAACGGQWSGAPARLYRWAEGSDITERQLVLRGTVSGAEVDDERAISFEVRSVDELRDGRLLPPYVVTEELWPNADEDDWGSRAPVCYGTFKGVSVPNIVGSSDKHAIGHHIASVSAGKVAGSSATPVLTNSTDADGVEYAELDYATETLDKDVTVDGTGIVDDGDGTYGGTADALITNLGAQLHHLAREVVGYAADEVDGASFRAFRDRFTAHVNALVVSGEDTKSFMDVAEEALSLYRAACYCERGLLKLRHLDLAATPRMLLREGHEIVSLDGITFGTLDDFPAKIQIKYDRRYVVKSKQWELTKRLVIDSSDVPLFARAEQLGADVVEIEAPHISDADTIALAAATTAELYGKLRDTVQITANRAALELDVYDLVQMTHSRYPSADGAGCAAKLFAVLGREDDREQVSLTLLEV